MDAIGILRRRWVRRFAWVLLAMAGTALAARAWLLRNPEPYFRARRTTVASVTEAPARLSGKMLEQDVVVHGANGLRVEFRIRRRADRSVHERAPLFVLLGGHMSGKESASLIADPRQYAVASLSYPFDGNERVTGIAVLGEVPAIRRAIFDTPPAVMLALDYLLARPDVDSTRVELVGASFGVPFVAVAGALDTRIRRIWLVQGGADPHALFLAGLREEIAFMPARKAVAALANLLASGPRFDPVWWVPRVTPRPVMMINTTDDERIPRSTTEALFSAARDPKQIVWLPGMHVQPNRPDVLRALVDAVFSQMDSVPAPAAGKAP